LVCSYLVVTDTHHALVPIERLRAPVQVIIDEDIAAVTLRLGPGEEVAVKHGVPTALEVGCMVFGERTALLETCEVNVEGEPARRGFLLQDHPHCVGRGDQKPFVEWAVLAESWGAVHAVV
jgi:hypothetical protein